MDAPRGGFRPRGMPPFRGRGGRGMMRGGGMGNRGGNIPGRMGMGNMMRGRGMPRGQMRGNMGGPGRPNMGGIQNGRGGSMRGGRYPQQSGPPPSSQGNSQPAPMQQPVQQAPPQQQQAPPQQQQQQPPENIKTPEKPVVQNPANQPQKPSVVVTSNQPAPQSQAPVPNHQNNHHQMSQPRGGMGGMRGRGMMQRGSMSRGRGNFNQGPPRQQFDTRQPSNTTTVTPIKRGGMNGPPISKRGRFEGPPSRHHMNPPQISSHPNSYNNMQSVHHGSYQDPNQHNQFMDQYSHSSYNSAPMPPQNSYMNNGYNQNSYSNSASQMGYGQSTTTDYDHSGGGGYTDYNSAPTYQTHDTRYSQSYSQDYRQPSYGPSSDYGMVSQDSYAAGQYDDRSYGNYSEPYSQGYMKSDSYSSHAGYY